MDRKSCQVDSPVSLNIVDVLERDLPVDASPVQESSPPNTIAFGVSRPTPCAPTIPTTQGRFEALSGAEVEEETTFAHVREEFDITSW